MHFFIFQAKTYKNIINYFIRKLVNAYAVAGKPLVFTITLIVKFGILWKFDLIFTIKIFANFVKPIVTTITLFHPTNTNFVTVAIQYFLKLMNPLNCSDLRYSVKLQGRNRLSEMCTEIDQYRHVAKLIFQN